MALGGNDGSIVLTTEVDESGLNKFKSGIGAAGKALAATAAAGAAGFVALTTSATKNYAEYEQLTGGVETLFKDSGDVVMKYADNAYLAAGLSANEYMDTVTGFSASLLQSLGGDTAKSAEYGNQAVIDMADNANKMGTSMESIQNAYQGFAKQNYTMLDNLKLGYGGTKEEMQRLLDDASKISGIKYDISSFADITEAIHVMQTEMGITGTTALEAEQTISGSANMMKASWQNLLTGFADPSQDIGALMENLLSSVTTFANNLLPVITNAANAIVQVLPSALTSALGLITQLLPSLITAMVGIVTQILDTLPSLIEQLVTALPGLIQQIVNALPGLIPALVTGIIQSLAVLISSLADIIQPIIDALPDILVSINQAVLDNLPTILSACIDLIVLVLKELPQLLVAQWIAEAKVFLNVFSQIGEWLKNAFTAAFIAVEAVWGDTPIFQFFNGVWEKIKEVFSAVEDVLGGFFSAAWNAIKSVWNTVEEFFGNIWDSVSLIFSAVESVLKGDFEGAWNAIKEILDTWEEFFSFIWEKVKNVFVSVETFFSDTFANAKKAVIAAFDKIKEDFSGIWKKIKEAFDFSEMEQIGKDMIKGLWNGISNMTTWIKNKIKGFCSSALNGIKDFFGINSPSRVFKDEIGKNLVLGMAEGISENEKTAISSLSQMAQNLTAVQFMPPQVESNALPFFTTAIAGVNGVNASSVNDQSGLTIKEEIYNLNETELMRIIYKLAKGGERINGTSLLNGGAY